MGEKRCLKEHLRENLLVGDGAMATYLYQQGVPVGLCYEELCLTRPDLIREVHRAYFEAGARLLETNTYGANRERLTRYGLEGKVTRINRTAVRLAREAAGPEAFVAGAIGSILAGRVPRYDRDEYRDMYEEQATALLHAGADAILLETFLDLEELLLAVEVIRPLSEVPVFAQLALIEVGRTRDGYPLTEAFRRLQEAGVDGVGLNCRLGPAECLRSLEQAVVPEDVSLSAFPNAGRLGITDGQYRYESSPAYFRESALRLREQGVRLIGGCCGTTPQHIRAMAEALRGLAPLPRINPENPSLEGDSVPLTLQPPRKEPTITEKVEAGRTVIVEYDPPRDLDITRFLHGATRLKEAGADAITLADNSMATARMSNMALGAILKSRGIEPPGAHHLPGSQPDRPAVPSDGAVGPGDRSGAGGDRGSDADRRSAGGQFRLRCLLLRPDPDGEAIERGNLLFRTAPPATGPLRRRGGLQSPRAQLGGRRPPIGEKGGGRGRLRHDPADVRRRNHRAGL